MGHRYYVYVLARPNGKAFYVGKGTKYRIYRHDTEARSGHKCHKCNIIRKIWHDGGVVQRYIVFTTDSEFEAFAYEQSLIAIYGRSNLANATDGGEGSSNPSEESLERRRAAMQGHWNDPEYRTKIVDAIRARWDDPEYRVRMQERYRTPELRALMKEKGRRAWGEKRAHTIAANKASKNKPEYRAKLSARQQATWNDPAAREQMLTKRRTSGHSQAVSATNKKRWSDPEYRARVGPKAIAKANALWSDPEYRAKMSEKRKARWAEPEYRAKMQAAFQSRERKKRDLTD